MFKLNFKEQLASIVVDQVVDKVAEKIFSPEDELDIPAELSNQYSESDVLENISSESTPLQTAKYQELIDAVNSAAKLKMQKQKQQGKNLFSLPSVLTIAVFAVTGILTQVDQSLADNVISTREWVQIAITGAGVIGSIAARGGEGSTGAYTPHILPGLNKEDFDGDGIHDDEDETPWGI